MDRRCLAVNIFVNISLYCIVALKKNTFNMKMATVNNKVNDSSTGRSSVMAPIKYFIYVGWLIGVFPINFDKQLKKFQFRCCSLTTVFSILRLILFNALISFPYYYEVLILGLLSDNKKLDNSINVTHYESNNASNESNPSKPQSKTTDSARVVIYLTSSTSRIIIF